MTRRAERSRAASAAYQAGRLRRSESDCEPKHCPGSSTAGKPNTGLTVEEPVRATTELGLSVTVGRAPAASVLVLDAGACVAVDGAIEAGALAGC